MDRDFRATVKPREAVASLQLACFQEGGLTELLPVASFVCSPFALLFPMAHTVFPFLGWSTCVNFGSLQLLHLRELK